MNILIFIIILLVLIISHEFGHFIVAKKSGIRVDEFAFGFPPRLFSYKKGETRYTFNLLPIGGYVKIFGENPDAESIDGPDKKRSFVHKPRWVQALVLVAGVVMNFLIAWILISAGFVTGMPTSVGSISPGQTLVNPSIVITSVLPNSPAEIAGLRPGDSLISLQSGKDITTVPSVDKVPFFVQKYKDQPIDVTYKRGKDTMTATIPAPEVAESKNRVIGISMDMIGMLKLKPSDAIWQGLKLSGNLFVATAVGFYDLVRNAILGQADMSSLTGPIGIVGIVGDAASFGFVYLLSLVALISINLAVINLIPFPALDGGRLLFLLIEKIKGSRLNPQFANWANMIGFGILMLLMIFITYHDIVKIIK